MPPVSTKFHDDELFVSFLSRRARALGVSGVFDLLLDLSLPRRGVLNGAAEASMDRFISPADRFTRRDHNKPDLPTRLTLTNHLIGAKLSQF